MNKTIQETFNNNLAYTLNREVNKELQALLINYDIDFKDDDDDILKSLNKLTNETNYCIYEILCEYLENGDNTNDIQTGWEMGYNRGILNFILIIKKNNIKIDY